MSCKTKTVKFAKAAWKVLGPVLAPHVTKMVMLIEEFGDQVPELISSNHAKRALVIQSTLKKAKAIGHEAYDVAKPVTVGVLESAIRAQIERSLYLLRESADDWMTIDDDSDEATPVSV